MEVALTFEFPDSTTADHVRLRLEAVLRDLYVQAENDDRAFLYHWDEVT